MRNFWQFRNNTIRLVIAFQNLKSFWRTAMASRIIMRIELTPKAKEHLEQISERQGMTQVAMLSRVIEWYARQPEVIQRIIVGHMPPEIQRDVARLVLQKLIKPNKGELTRSRLSEVMEGQSALGGVSGALPR
jgi:hypothetical protein